MSGNSQTEQKPSPSPPTTAPPKATTTTTPPPPRPAAPIQKEPEGPLLFHFAECTNCHHLLPISTTTEKYFAILAKEPKKAVGLGERCMRCGADSWKLVTG